MRNRAILTAAARGLTILGDVAGRTRVAWLLCLMFIVPPLACSVSSAASTSNSSLEDNFGGLSLGPNDNNVVNVYMVNPSIEQAKAIARRELDYTHWKSIRKVRAVKVKYSKNQLDKWFRLLYDDLNELNYKEVSGGGVDIVENQVTIRVVCGAGIEKIKNALQERMAIHAIPRDVVVVEFGGQARILPKPMRPFMYACMPAEVVKDPATGTSSPGFGGFYHESGTIHVYLLEPSQKRAEELALIYFGRSIVEEMGVRPVQGQFTWEQLQEWYRVILDDSRWRTSLDAVPCDVESKLNRITIEVRRSYNENVVEEVEEWLSSIDVPREAVTLIDGDVWPGRVPLQ